MGPLLCLPVKGHAGQTDAKSNCNPPLMCAGTSWLSEFSGQEIDLDAAFKDKNTTKTFICLGV